MTDILSLQERKYGVQETLYPTFGKRHINLKTSLEMLEFIVFGCYNSDITSLASQTFRELVSILSDASASRRVIKDNFEVILPWHNRLS